MAYLWYPYTFLAVTVLFRFWFITLTIFCILLDKHCGERRWTRFTCKSYRSLCDASSSSLLPNLTKTSARWATTWNYSVNGPLSQWFWNISTIWLFNCAPLSMTLVLSVDMSVKNFLWFTNARTTAEYSQCNVVIKSFIAHFAGRSMTCVSQQTCCPLFFGIFFLNLPVFL